MAEEKEKVQDQETRKTSKGERGELSEQDLEKAVGGAKGESTDKDHKDWIDITAV